jgi:hypothetical protein
VTSSRRPVQAWNTGRRAVTDSRHQVRPAEADPGEAAGTTLDGGDGSLAVAMLGEVGGEPSGKEAGKTVAVSGAGYVPEQVTVNGTGPEQVPGMSPEATGLGPGHRRQAAGMSPEATGLGPGHRRQAAGMAPVQAAGMAPVQAAGMAPVQAAGMAPVQAAGMAPV